MHGPLSMFVNELKMNFVNKKIEMTMTYVVRLHQVILLDFTQVIITWVGTLKSQERVRFVF